MTCLAVSWREQNRGLSTITLTAPEVRLMVYRLQNARRVPLPRPSPHFRNFAGSGGDIDDADTGGAPGGISSSTPDIVFLGLMATAAMAFAS